MCLEHGIVAGIAQIGQRSVVFAECFAEFLLEVVLLFGILHQLFHPSERCGIGVAAVVVLSEFCQSRSLLDGFVEASELVYESEFLCLLSGPNASLSDAVHIVDGHAVSGIGAALGHAVEEEGISAVHILLHHFAFFGVEGTSHGTEIAALVGLYPIERESELVGQEFAGIGNHAEDADAAGEGGGLGKDVVGTATHVVSAACCQTAHGYDHGFLLLEELYGAPHLLAGVGRTSAGIDAEHDGLHLLVLCQFVKVGHHLVADDFGRVAGHAGCAGLFNDAAFGHVYSHFVRAAFCRC